MPIPMVIAIPNCQGRVSPLLDTAARLLVLQHPRGRSQSRREIQLGALPTEALARSLAELKVDVLLCAAISESLFRRVRALGVRVVPHLCGEVEAILQAFCEGRLRHSDFHMPGCWGRHTYGMCARARGRRPPSRRARNSNTPPTTTRGTIRNHS